MIKKWIKEKLLKIRKKHNRAKIKKGVMHIRFKRGEKQWFLRNTDAFVWARTEEMAQKKWTKKLLKDLEKHGKHN